MPKTSTPHEPTKPLADISATPSRTPALVPRAALAGIPEYHAPFSGRTGLRLDMNENSVGCSPLVRERLRSLADDALSAYPERAPVEAAVARWVGLQPGQILLTNGADEGIHLLCQTYLEAGDQFVIPVPTFTMFDLYAAQCGANIVAVPSGADFALPVDGILKTIAQLDRPRLIAVATPNNPTGAVIMRADVIRILEAAPSSAVLIDEAYYEFFGESCIDLIAKYPNLFIARTFSKAYGMAGMRAGFIAGSAEQMGYLRRIASPFNVNGPALACVGAAIEDTAFVSNFVSEVRASRAALAEGLRALGLQTFPSEANFLLVRLAEDAPRGRAIIRALAGRGVLIRDRSADHGCAGCARITVGNREQTKQVLAALSSALNQVSSELGNGAQKTNAGGSQ